MNFSKLLIAVLLFAASPVFAEGIKPVLLMYGAASAPGSTVLISQPLYNSTTGDLATYYIGTRFTLGGNTGSSTMSFTVNFATVGTSCEVRVSNANTTDLSSPLVSDTFTPSTGENTVQLTTGNIGANNHTIGFHCDGGTLRRQNTDVEADLTYRFSTTSWNLSSTDTQDLTIEIAIP